MLNCIGKTLISYEKFKIQNYDDENFLKLTFSDGDFIFIEGDFKNYSGKSIDEYPRSLNIYTKENIEELSEDKYKIKNLKSKYLYFENKKEIIVEKIDHPVEFNEVI